MPRPKGDGVTLISTLGLTPAVVTETVALLFKNISSIYIVRTNHESIEVFANILAEVFNRLGVNTNTDFVIWNSDIVSSKDNIEFVDRLVDAIRRAPGRIAISIAGGRKTMSAMATYIALTYPDERVRSKIDLLLHVLVPPEIEEKCNACRHWNMMEYIKKFDRGKLIDAIVRRLNHVINSNLECSTVEACPSSIKSVDDLAICFTPCKPKDIVVIPGGGLVGDTERLLALISLVFKKVYDTMTGILKIDRKKLDSIRSNPKRYGLNLIGDLNDENAMRDFIINVLDNLEPGGALPRRRTKLEYKGFRESGHHVRDCMHLDEKIYSLFSSGGVPSTYVWKIEQGGVRSSRDTALCKGSLGDERDVRGSFKVEVWVKCRNQIGMLRMYLTAITRRQAEVMVKEIEEYLRDRGLCR